MKWTARLSFKACGCRQVRQELDSAGNALGEAVATPYCPERFLTLVSIKDGEGREFQIGTDAIDICVKLPPNTARVIYPSTVGQFPMQSDARAVLSTATASSIGIVPSR